MKHTPTPWTYDKESVEVRDVNGIILAKIALGQHSAIQKMVNAVNSHDELLEAAKEAAETIRGIISSCFLGKYEEIILQDSYRLEKAIAKAEGKE